MKQLLLILALTTQFLAVAPASADWYPDELKHQRDRSYGNGTIDAIDFARHRVTINDRVFRFSEETTVHSRHSQDDSQGLLRRGIRVGFKLNAPMPQGNYIQAFWLLPTNFMPSESGLE